MEVVFLEGRLRLIVVNALGIYLPVFATQACHHTKLTKLLVGREIEGVDIIVIDKAVIEERILLQTRVVCRKTFGLSCGSILETALRGVLVGESSLVTGLNLEGFAHLILIIQPDLPMTVVHIHGTILVTIRVLRIED